ncbi:Ig-like domain-containing protein [Ramlibacter montanisoli]|uniref:Ig-like domain-containing protein n=1 Tax=Ramlibacter montanisoli TaxID=2732512 RepID=A0A849KFK3_9BURK|nr:Ig-like domain-containing protein [Ramlibacter montanisoli]NNU43715.1 hypothetical protein [Ramlibacter montanisoli]
MQAPAAAAQAAGAARLAAKAAALVQRKPAEEEEASGALAGGASEEYATPAEAAGDGSFQLAQAAPAPAPAPADASGSTPPAGGSGPAGGGAGAEAAGSGGMAALGILGAVAVLAAAGGGGGGGGGSSSAPAPAPAPDTTAPVAPTVALRTDTGASGTDRVTSSGELALGNLEAGATVQYSTNAGTTWSSSFRTGGRTEQRAGAPGGRRGQRQQRRLVQLHPGLHRPRTAVDDGAERRFPTITLSYDSPLDAANLPAAGAFTVMVGGVANPVSGVTVAGAVVTLVLANPLAAGAAVTVRYTDPTTGNDAGALQDLAGNDAGGFSTGIVADGYLRGAQIHVDANNNRAADAGEVLPGVVTDGQGQFVLAAGTPAGVILATGGVNVDTGVPNALTLVAPAGSSVVNPLTTLVQAVLDNNPGATLAQANTLVVNALGLPAGTDLAHYDPLAVLAVNPTDAAALSVQTAVATVATIVTLAAAAPAGTLTPEAAADQVFSNLATQMGTPAAPAAPLDLTSASSDVAAALAGASAASEATILAATVAIDNATSLSGVFAAQAAALDTIAPAAPTLALAAASDSGASSSDGISNDSTPSVRVTFLTTASDGTSAVAGDTITVTDGGAPVATHVLTATDVAAGFVDITLPALGADGAHALSATVTDIAGQASSAATQVTVTLDTTIATPTLALATDTGAVDGITGNAALNVSAAAGDVTRSFSINGGAASATYVAPTVDGAYTVAVTDTDTAGNTQTASVSFTLDTTIATPTIALVADTGAADGITGNAALNISAAAGDVTRSFSINGGAASATYVAPTTDGAYNVVVNDTDTAGNTQTASVSFTLDTTIATPTIALTADTGAADGITSNAALNISAAAGDVTRSFSINGGAASATYVAPTTDGAYNVVVNDTDTAGNTQTASASFTLDTTIATPTIALAADTGASGADGITSNAALTVSATAGDVTRSFSINGGAASATYVAPTVDGAYTVAVTDTDIAGNTRTASVAFTLDASAPAPLVVTLATDSGTSNSDNLTNDATLAIVGQDLGATVEYSIDAGATWSTTFTPVEGANSFLVRQVDVAGNVGTSTSLTFTLDTLAAAPAAALASDTGSSSADRVTSNAALAFTGQEGGATLEFSTDGGTSWSTTQPTATEGANQFLLRQVDAAGNTSGSTPFAFTLDTTIATPTIALSSDTGASGADGITSSAALNVSAAAGDVTRSFSINSGAASATYVAPTTDGAYNVVVTDTDTAGNSRTASVSFTRDATIATPTIALSSDTGTSGADGITSNAALTVSAAAGDVTRSFSINGGPASGSYVAPSIDGPYTVAVTDTDTAGNTQTASLAFTLDTTIATPTIALVADTGAADGITSNAALNVSAAAGDVTRSFSINGGAASATYAAPAIDGDYTVAVADTDAAGNTQTASLVFTLDKTIATPTIALTTDTGASGADGFTSSAALTVSAAAGDVTRSFSINGGAASATYVAPTTGGAYTVAVTDTDTAGNTQTSSVSFTLDTGAPTLVSSSPADNAVDSTAGTIVLTFSEAVAAGTGNILIADGAAGLSIAIGDTSQVAISGNTVSITPAGGTAPNVTYSVTIGSGVLTDLAGNAFGGIAPGELDFTMANSPTVTIASDEVDSLLNVGDTTTVTFTLSEASTDFTVDDVTVAGGTLSGFAGSGTSYTALLTPAAGSVTAASVSVAAGGFTGGSGFGNIASSILSINVDTVPPTAPTISVDGTINAAERDAGVTVSGTTESGSTVTVNGSPATVTGTSWSHVLDAAAINAFGEGAETLTVVATDASGNTTTATASITVDTTPPAAPLVGLVAGDDTINATERTATVTVTGTTEAGSSVTVNGVAAVVTGTSWSHTLSAAAIDAFGQGAETLNVVATDAAGNTSSGSRNISVDTAGPALPTLDLVAGDDIVNAGERGTGVTLTGTTDTGTTVTVNGNLATVTGSTWSYALDTLAIDAFGQGTETLTIAATDAAGNSSSTSRNVTVDTVGPAAPLVDSVTGDDVLNASERGAGVTVTGSTEAGSTVTVNGNAATVTGTSWSYNLDTAAINAFGEGAETLTVVATDAAGNIGSAGSKAITVDTLGPTLVSSTPADNATAVGAAANIVLTFGENVFAGTGNIVVSDGTTSIAIAATDPQVSFSGSTVTINPAADLALGTGYHVTIAAGAILDSFGNAHAGISDPTVLNFTTVAAPDLTAPTLQSLATVDNGATSTITLTFSEAVQRLDSGLPLNLVLHRNPNPQDGQGGFSQPQLSITGIAGEGTTTLVVTVTGAVAPSDVLRVRLGTGLADLNGNAFSATEFWFGGNGNDSIALDNYGSDLPIEMRGQGGSDTLVGSFQNDRIADGGGIDTLSGGGGADAIILVENGTDRPYSRDTVQIGLFESRTGGGLADAIVGQTGVAGTGFDVSSANLADHDVLSLPSSVIAVNASNANGTDSGTVAQHDITSGIVTFKDTAGTALAINQANSGNAINYLAGVLAAGETAAFAYDSDSNGSADSLLLFQDNGGFAPHTLVRLGGLQGATLGTTAANGVVLLADHHRA